MKKFTIKHYALSLIVSILAINNVSAMGKNWSAHLLDEKNTATLPVLNEEYFKQIKIIGQEVAQNISTLKTTTGITEKQQVIDSLIVKIKNKPQADEFYCIMQPNSLIPFPEFLQAGSESITSVSEALKDLGQQPAELKSYLQTLATTLKTDFLKIFIEKPEDENVANIPAVKDFLTTVDALDKNTEPEIVLNQQSANVIEQEQAKLGKINPETVYTVGTEKEQVIGKEQTEEQVIEQIVALAIQEMDEAQRKTLTTPTAETINENFLASLVELVSSQNISEEAIDEAFEEITENIVNMSKLLNDGSISLTNKQRNTFKKLVLKQIINHAQNINETKLLTHYYGKIQEIRQQLNNAFLEVKPAKVTKIQPKDKSTSKKSGICLKTALIPTVGSIALYTTYLTSKIIQETGISKK